jgi:hypothetical protein
MTRNEITLDYSPSRKAPPRSLRISLLFASGAAAMSVLMIVTFCWMNGHQLGDGLLSLAFATLYITGLLALFAGALMMVALTGTKRKRPLPVIAWWYPASLGAISASLVWTSMLRTVGFELLVPSGVLLLAALISARLLTDGGMRSPS